ncbi:monosaccharide ABC transporter membrane protein (CUT2 family) [Hydrogenispora ethanolica]|jgi:simple sugar transport system permease protein|uniref:Monosaccharide ABC transporter membrane protein (CUT2 family) n=1 Tax=Hydrogenispora ethanolica TaxID=1082276 RepID=A0A4R1RTM5_HYDET|nr:ABC transporter permease [Hydrogenispora ethanolica]TCL69893.1 monosaccharide ABC transporter membrane protein (CUT2 family) [Hydrogenispora ethanolica]
MKSQNFFANQSFRALFWPLMALIIILLFNIFFTKGFINVEIRDGHLFGSMIDILNRAAPVLILAIGMTLVIGTGGIDLSVGAVIAISGAVAALMIRPEYLKGVLEYSQAPPLYMIVGTALFVSLIAGLWNGFVVSYLDIQPMVGTLILMVAGRGIAQLITQGQILIFVNKDFQFIGSGFFLGLPFSLTIVAFLLIVTYLLTRKTAIGLYIESVGDNPTASRYAGINARMVKLLVYTFSGLCAGIAGLIITSDIKGADANNAGLNMELDAILSVVMGGTSMNGGRIYLLGSVIGALFIQTLTTTILTRGVNPELTLVVKAVVVIIVCLLQSDKFREIATVKARRVAA